MLIFKPAFSLSSLTFIKRFFSSSSLSAIVQFSHSVVSDSLRPHESQHTRPLCPSPNPGVHPNSCPSSQWCHPAIYPWLSPSPPVPNPSQHQGLFQWVNTLHEVAKVLEFQLQLSNEHPGLISFRMDWLDLLAVQGTLKSLLQHHSSKASVLWCSAFLMVQQLSSKHILIVAQFPELFWKQYYNVTVMFLYNCVQAFCY